MKCIESFFSGIVQSNSNVNVAKKMSVIHSFCPQGLHSGFGVHFLRVCLSFCGSPHPVLNSCGARVGSRESYSSRRTHKDVLLSGFKAPEGVESLSCIFPCHLLTAGWIWDWGDLLCPPDPSIGPEAVSSPLLRYSIGCVCVCGSCVCMCVSGSSVIQ